MSQLLHVACPHCNAINRLPRERLAHGGKCGKCGSPLFSATPLTLTASNFQAHIQRSDLPVLVDFWAAWCGPCQMMAPVFAQAAKEMEPALRFAKVDTEQQQGLAAQYNIRSIPSLILFKQGREVARHAGAVDLAQLRMWINQQL